MTIPKLTPYAGQVANPDGSQTQSEFTQNMFDQLSYEAQLATQLDATIDGMNNAVDEVEAFSVSAENSANAAEAAASSAGYQGLWPDTGGSALKGETWQTQVGGVPTGNYYTALQNTTADPAGDNVNWKVNISASDVRNPNLLSNGQFKIASPDDSLPAPSATPQDYPAGFQIFSGWFTDDVNGASGVTRVNEILNWNQDGVSSIYTLVPKDGDLTEYTASLAGKAAGAITGPYTSHVSFSDNGDGNWRITIANSAADIYICKFEQGSVATGHEAQSAKGQTYTFNTVAEMIANSAPVGSKVQWLGYYAASDGGSNWGVVKEGNHTEDGGKIFSIDANTYIEANLKGKSVSILKYGAMPDWDDNTETGTDNTDAIVRCVTENPVTKIPKGHDFAVGLNGSCFWDGLSNRRITGGGTLHKIGSKGVFSFANCSEIEVDRIVFDGQIVADEAANGNIIDETRSPTDYAFAISFANSSNCKAERNRVYDFAWDGIVAQGTVDPGGLTATQSTNIVFHRNRLGTVRGSQLWMKAVDGFEVSRNRCINPTTFNQKANAIFAVEWCHNGSIDHNKGFYIGDNFIGIGEQVNKVIEARNKKIDIHNNECDITRYHSILIAQGEDIDVHHNILTKAAAKDNMAGGASAVLSAGITVLGGSDGAVTSPRNTRVKVRDNTITNSYELGVYTVDRVNTTLAESSDDIEVTGNTISGSGKLPLATRIQSGGILSQIQKPVKITGNKCKFNNGDGIRVFGDAIITGNDSSLNDGRGILVPTDTIWGNTKLSSDLESNTCEDNSGTGIEVFGKSDIGFVSNECHRNGTASPTTEDPANAILHAGIGVQSCTRVTTSSNKCDGNGSSGIAGYLCSVFDNSQNHTSDNGKTFTVANYRSGIYLEGAAGGLVKSTSFMCNGVAGSDQQYPIRILFNDNAVALDCRYDTHPNNILGALEKSSFNI